MSVDNDQKKFVVTTANDHEAPNQALLEAITWCTSRHSKTLRTPEMAPRALEASYRDSVRSVVLSRRRHLGRARLPVDAPAGGRLVAYFPDADLACGTAGAASQDFFDVNNAPPWDTWVLLAEQSDQTREAYGTCLIAWVPPAFVARAARGIEVNPEECICWLDDCSPELQEAVSRACGMPDTLLAGD